VYVYENGLLFGAIMDPQKEEKGGEGKHEERGACRITKTRNRSIANRLFLKQYIMYSSVLSSGSAFHLVGSDHQPFLKKVYFCIYTMVALEFHTVQVVVSR
jgi:hypothetical protein